MSSNYEINETFAYCYISIACIIGFLYGMYNWYSVSSIDIKNNLDIKYGTTVIEENLLKELYENSKKISDVKFYI